MRKKGISYKWAFMSLILLAVSSFAHANTIIYVDDDANGTNDGSSWQNAYKYLQDALADANSAENPVEIRVAQGTYKPDQGVGQTTGDKESSFRLTGGVALSGGYAGIFKPDPNERNIENYKTILSGDLSGDDIEVNDPNDLVDEPSREENSYFIITTNWPDSASVLDGFTINGGNGKISSGMRGGGGRLGGGIKMDFGKLRICNCSFINNLSSNGAGIYITYGHLNLINCIFKANAASSGGGIYDNYDGELKLVNCVFENNLSYGKGGGIYYKSKINIANTNFKNNSASDGGAIYLYNFLQDSSVTNSLFSGNSVTNNGGAIYLEQNIYNYNLEIRNSTFAQNSALHGNAIFSSNDIKIRNSILHNGGQDEIWNNNASKIEIFYSNVQNGQASIYDPNVKLVWGEGNIDSEPLFADPNNDDYHLKSQAGRWDSHTKSWIIDNNTSPCIDAGDPMSPIGYEPFPNGGKINIGAYGGTNEASKSYFGKPICETIVAGDINGDCRVDISDMLIMLLHWLEDNNPVNVIVIEGVEFHVQTDKTFYEIGENVQMEFRVTNLKDEVVNIGCSQGSYLNLKVLKDEKQIWSKVQGSTTDTPNVKLLAAESKIIYHSWDMKDDDGYLVGPGTYQVVGIMYNAPWNDAREPGNYYPTEVRIPITISASTEP